MNVTVARDQLSRLLYLTSTIVERRNTMPILANVRLTAEKGKLLIAATDLEVSLSGEVEAEVKTGGGITVGARVLYDIVRELADATVNIQLSKGQRLELQCGQSRFKINGIASDEFPAIMGTTILTPISIEASRLYEMLEKTAFAVSTDETRYNINGVLVETTESATEKGKSDLRLVATDGHRLAMIDRPADGISLKNGVIVPRKGIQELKKLLEDNEGAANLQIHEGFLTVQSGAVTMGVRLVDGQFPDYKQVVPSETKTTAVASRNSLLAAVKRVSLMTTDKSRAIKFRLFDSELTVSSSSPEYGEASESLALTQQGENLTIGFSSRYVIDLLTAMEASEVVTIKFSGELGPAIFNGSQDDRYNCIVMPMRFE